MFVTEDLVQPLLMINPSVCESIGSRNWGKGSTGDKNATHSVAFTGLVDVGKAVAGYTEGASWCCPELRGIRMLSLGGGNSAGVFNQQNIEATVTPSAISEIKAAGCVVI